MCLETPILLPSHFFTMDFLNSEVTGVDQLILSKQLRAIDDKSQDFDESDEDDDASTDSYDDNDSSAPFKRHNNSSRITKAREITKTLRRRVKDEVCWVFLVGCCDLPCQLWFDCLHVSFPW